MDVSAVGNAQSFAGLSSSPLVQMLQTQQQNDSALFSGASGTPSDLISFTPTAAASSLFNDPALLLQLQSWDGSQTPGSARPAVSDTTPPPAATPQFSFDPFDQSTWAGKPAQSSDSAPPTTQQNGYHTATGVVVPYPQFSFNPFDKSSWWSPPTGNNVNTLA